MDYMWDRNETWPFAHFISLTFLHLTVLCSILPFVFMPLQRWVEKNVQEMVDTGEKEKEAKVKGRRKASANGLSQQRKKHEKWEKEREDAIDVSCL